MGGQRVSDYKPCYTLKIRGVPLFVLACIEGNGSRPSHRGLGITTETKVMYTLNSTECHGVAYELPRENRIADGE